MYPPLERLENCFVGAGLAGPLEPAGQFRLVGDGHPVVARDDVGADVEFVEVVVQSGLEFVDESCGGVELAPGRFGSPVELPAQRNEVVRAHTCPSS